MKWFKIVILVLGILIAVNGLLIVIESEGQSVDSGGGAGFFGLLMLIIGLSLTIAPIKYLLSKRKNDSL